MEAGGGSQGRRHDTCFEEEHGLVYKTIRQCLIYDLILCLLNLLVDRFAWPSATGHQLHLSSPLDALSRIVRTFSALSTRRIA